MASNKRRIELEVGLGRIVILLEDFEGATVGELISNLKEEGEDEYNNAIDGMESLILAHACAGIDVQSDKYIESIEVAIDAISNNI